MIPVPLVPLVLALLHPTHRDDLISPEIAVIVPPIPELSDEPAGNSAPSPLQMLYPTATVATINLRHPSAPILLSPLTPDHPLPRVWPGVTRTG